jgi:hypothetical protein
VNSNQKLKELQSFQSFIVLREQAAMQHDWILDVLADLQSFASASGLNTLAEQLEDTALIAAADIASKQGGTAGANEDKGEYRPNSGGAGQHNSA